MIPEIYNLSEKFKAFVGYDYGLSYTLPTSLGTLATGDFTAYAEEVDTNSLLTFSKSWDNSSRILLLSLASSLLTTTGDYGYVLSVNSDISTPLFYGAFQVVEVL